MLNRAEHPHRPLSCPCTAPWPLSSPNTSSYLPPIPPGGSDLLADCIITSMLLGTRLPSHLPDDVDNLPGSARAARPRCTPPPAALTQPPVLSRVLHVLWMLHQEWTQTQPWARGRGTQGAGGGVSAEMAALYDGAGGRVGWAEQPEDDGGGQQQLDKHDWLHGTLVQCVMMPLAACMAAGRNGGPEQMVAAQQQQQQQGFPSQALQHAQAQQQDGGQQPGPERQQPKQRKRRRKQEEAVGPRLGQGQAGDELPPQQQHPQLAGVDEPNDGVGDGGSVGDGGGALRGLSLLQLAFRQLPADSKRSWSWQLYLIRT